MSLTNKKYTVIILLYYYCNTITVTCNCLEATQGNLIYQTDLFLTGANIAKINKFPLSNFPILNKYLFKSRIMTI